MNMRTGVRLSMAAVLAGSLLVTGCAATNGTGGTDPSSDPERVYKFGVAGVLVHPFYEQYPIALADAASDLGLPIEPTFAAPQNPTQVDQNSILDGWASQGYTGIAVQISDPVAGSQQIDRLVDQGIHVIETGFCAEQANKASLCINVGQVPLATEAAESIAEALNGKGKVVMLAGEPGDATFKVYVDTVTETLAKYPDIELVQVLSGMDDQQAAQQKLASLFASRENEIDGILSISGAATPLLAQKLEELDNKRIIAIGLNTFPEATLDGIRKGYLYGTMPQNAYALAYLSAYSLKLLEDGCTYNGPPPPAFVDTGSFLVTKETVDSIEDELKKATQELVEGWEDRFDCPAG